MERTLKYSVLRYAPLGAYKSSVLGVVFSEEASGLGEFCYTCMEKLKKYEDGAFDAHTVYRLLLGIQEDVTAKASKGSFDIEEYIRFYINDFAFGDIQAVKCEDVTSVMFRICSSLDL